MTLNELKLKPLSRDFKLKVKSTSLGLSYYILTPNNVCLIGERIDVVDGEVKDAHSGILIGKTQDQSEIERLVSNYSETRIQSHLDKANGCIRCLEMENNLAWGGFSSRGRY